MVMKNFLAEIVDGRLVIPDEALALLPVGVQLRVITDSENGTVCIHAKDPMLLSPETEELMDALAELSKGHSNEQYFAAPSDEMLQEIKRQRRESEGGQ